MKNALKIIRSKKNPIITKEMIRPFDENGEILGVFNCGVANYNGKIILLLRVAEKLKDRDGKAFSQIYNAEKKRMDVYSFEKNDPRYDFSDVRFIRDRQNGDTYLTSISRFYIATSSDGENFTVEDHPFMTVEFEHEELGIEDPRITFIDGKYYINYSCCARNGVTTSLAVTEDFVHVQKLGIIFLSDNKDVAIFPQKINGKYYALNRPVSACFNIPEIWIASSDNLLDFGHHKKLLGLRENCFDSARIGAGCVPVLTEEGWLELYHGCDKNNRYCMGAVLLDKDDPSKVLMRSKEPILFAEEGYETNGFMPEVIFACGCIREGDDLTIYYGACDESVCMARLSVKNILNMLESENATL